MTFTAKNDLSMAQMVLLTGHLLSNDKPIFTAEDLAVSAWKKWTESFGMKGYESLYPDTNKTNYTIMGERGLVRRGWFAKVGEKKYSITKEGKRLAALILGEPVEQEPEPKNLEVFSSYHERIISSITASIAYRKFQAGKKMDLSFTDACDFWNITQLVKGLAVDTRLHMVTKELTEIEESLAQADKVLSNGTVITAGDIRVMKNIHQYMQDRFDRLLDLLRSRK